MYTLFRSKSNRARKLSRNKPVKDKWSSDEAWCHDPALEKPPTRKSKSALDKTQHQTIREDIQFNPPSVIVRRDSYSTITTLEEGYSPENSLLFSSEPPASFTSDKAYIIPKMICFSKKEEDEVPQDMPLMQKAKFVPDPMNVGDFYGDDISSKADLPGWPKPTGSSKTRKSPRQLLDEMDTPSCRTTGKNGRSLLRRGVSIGLDSLQPPIRSEEFAAPRPSPKRMEI